MPPGFTGASTSAASTLELSTLEPEHLLMASFLAGNPYLSSERHRRSRSSPAVSSQPNHS
ncbi:hypothetical protein E2562_012888 [Oryza meyeriana var. granulata]|uniref:Uncharacterized protein n=1 Tax=Oryza meyeriana var. granulata TaxID=110450 RepID=A0A6G1CGZ0_9ORYZ|nr:hypothetical protein E2562_012888 [Oryza meyeriana var. granulata]